MVKFTSVFNLISIVMLVVSCSNPKEINLFDGNSFNGWEGPTEFFRIEKNAIVAGNLRDTLFKSYYLCTDKRFKNFELKVDVKIKSNSLNTSGGISFRADRVINSTEVMGYQADVGYINPKLISQFSDFTPKNLNKLYPLWGSLVDENRPEISRYPNPDIFPVVIYKVANKDLVDKIVDPYNWNNIHIRAIDSLILIKVNGEITAEFIEKEKVKDKGCICLQAQSGEAHETWYQNISLKI